MIQIILSSQWFYVSYIMQELKYRIFNNEPFISIFIFLKKQKSSMHI